MTAPDLPWEPPTAGTETEHLLGMLDRLRTTFRWKADELDAAVDVLAAALVAPMPGVVTETKALLQGAAERDLDEQRRLEREAQVRRFRAVAAASAG